MGKCSLSGNVMTGATISRFKGSDHHMVTQYHTQLSCLLNQSLPRQWILIDSNWSTNRLMDGLSECRCGGCHGRSDMVIILSRSTDIDSRLPAAAP